MSRDTDREVFFVAAIVGVFIIVVIAQAIFAPPPPPPKSIEQIRKERNEAAREAGKTTHEYLKGVITGK